MGFKLSLLCPFYFALLSCQFAQMSFAAFLLFSNDLDPFIKLQDKHRMSTLSYINQSINQSINQFIPNRSIEILKGNMKICYKTCNLSIKNDTHVKIYKNQFSKVLYYIYFHSYFQNIAKLIHNFLKKIVTCIP